MERELTVGRICIVSFIAGPLAVGHASLIHSDRGRRPFCSAQFSQSLVRSGVWSSRQDSRFMGSDAA